MSGWLMAGYRVLNGPVDRSEVREEIFVVLCNFVVGNSFCVCGRQ